MKVAIVNTYDKIGGAARAALRLHRALHLCGVPAESYVRQKLLDLPSITEVRPVTPAELAAAKVIEAGDDQDRSLYPMLADNRHPMFTTEKAGWGPALNNRLDQAELVNLHWVRDLLDWHSFFSTRPQGQAVVWTMHDTLPFTGGCHYPGTCLNFTRECGCCPHLGSADPDDLSAAVLKRKKAALREFKGPVSMIAPSRWMADICQRSELWGGRPVSVIPNGIDTDVFRPAERAALRQELGIPPGAPVVLFVASVIPDPRKGFPYVIEALERLLPDTPFILTTVGHTPPLLPDTFPHIYLGQTENDRKLSKFYAVADVLVLPSLEDNLPNTAMEALACGTPVVAFPSGGIPDLVDDTCGALTPALSGEGLAFALSSLLNNADRLAVLSRNSRAKAEQEYALEVHGKRYIAHYQDVLMNPECWRYSS